MFSDRVYLLIERQRQQELEKQAEMYRQIKIAQQAHGAQSGIGRRLVNRLGRLLIDWGERLQAHAAPEWSPNETW
ncbi:MAG TPA: hypothetical protein VHO48_06445 [Anaerolineaceae bacterium]|jgi:hypothetical protein|nr:hypothetical protein [Anaerolineaceae bacterium]